MEGRFRIALLTGGTGGHIFPALAVWEAARSDPRLEVELGVGSPRLEDLPEDAVVYEAPRLRPLYRSVRALPRVIRLAWFWKHRLAGVDAVVGFGSYTVFPALLGALWARVPLYLHEQNAVPGRVTRLMAPVARRVFLSFPSALPRFSRKGVWVGNPVRPALLRPDVSREAARAMVGVDPGAWVVGVMGGSQGARGLLEKVLPVLGQTPDVMGLVLTGERNFAWARERFGYPNLRFLPFERDMRRFYRAVDAVISRAGGGSIAEILVFRIPALLVPFPHAADDHQRHNAREMVRVGAMEMVEERDLHPRVLRTWMAHVRDRDYRQRMQEAMARVARPRAAWDLLRHVVEDLQSSPGEEGVSGAAVRKDST